MDPEVGEAPGRVSTRLRHIGKSPPRCSLSLRDPHTSSIQTPSSIIARCHCNRIPMYPGLLCRMPQYASCAKPSAAFRRGGSVIQRSHHPPLPVSLRAPRRRCGVPIKAHPCTRQRHTPCTLSTSAPSSSPTSRAQPTHKRQYTTDAHAVTAAGILADACRCRCQTHPAACGIPNRGQQITRVPRTLS
jgi:hypothetical protein